MRRNPGRIVSAAAVLLAVSATVTFAAAPVRGATYRGTLAGARSSITVSFRVSPGGSEVQAIHVSALPIFCSGGAPPNTTLKFGTARVSGAGTFSTTGRDLLGGGPLKGTVAATLAITGTFAANRGESGTLTTIFAGSAKRCGGRARYHTRG